ncbi:MAG: Lrp/AsnC ligand binding domain-containing protein [archaeon GB-1867-005]|nr:Lrp/AsnC ligand binding domain-containing protein [Candidatus Culexmicrobium cathedralense]
MPEAFIVMNVKLGLEEETLNEILKIEGVEEAYTVYGVYDIVAKVKAETLNKLKKIVTWKIRRLSSIMSTTTMVVIEGRKKTSIISVAK